MAITHYVFLMMLYSDVATFLKIRQTTYYNLRRFIILQSNVFV